MKSRIVRAKLQQEAKEILHVVSEELDIPLCRIRAGWAEGSNHNQDTILARKIAVYFIRSKTQLQRDLVANMVGISQPHYISTMFKEVYERRKHDDKVKGLLQHFEQIFNK